MDTVHEEVTFGAALQTVRAGAGLSSRKLARASGLAIKRVSQLESGDGLPTDRELGVLAQACGVSVFDLLPPGYTLRVLLHDGTAGPQELQGQVALDALLREYVAMVVELRAGRAVTPPTLRHEDLVELATALGDTPESIEARLVNLLGADDGGTPVMQSLMQLPGAS